MKSFATFITLCAPRDTQREREWKRSTMRFGFETKAAHNSNLYTLSHQDEWNNQKNEWMRVKVTHFPLFFFFFFSPPSVAIGSPKWFVFASAFESQMVYRTNHRLAAILNDQLESNLAFVRCIHQQWRAIQNVMAKTMEQQFVRTFAMTNAASNVVPTLIAILLEK